MPVTITLPAGALTLAVRTALDEDLGAEGDPTSRLLGARATARLVARDPGVVAGLAAVDVVLAEVRERLRLGPAAFRPEVADSAPVAAGAVLGHFAGPARVLLAAERTMLNLLGHEAHAAYDGEAAVTAAEHLAPQVVVLDLGMPRLNGYEACRRIREQAWGRNMLLIALTGWGQEEDRIRAKEAGFDAHLVKPVDAATLLRASTPARAAI